LCSAVVLSVFTVTWGSDFFLAGIRTTGGVLGGAAAWSGE
jgi:hypothetical protein